MASDQDRSPYARVLAEEALVRFALALGPRIGNVVIIGGLNPSFLTAQPPVPHLGTTDVDVLLEVGFVFDRDEMDFAWLETGLQSAGFEPNPTGVQPWRWYVRLDGLLVKLDLLCDAYDSPGQELALPGCKTVVAQNLKGPRPALLDSVEHSLAVSIELRAKFPNAPELVAVRFAGLGGYVMSKAAAAVIRGEPKDFYDLAFVLLYNREGGPEGAARAVDRLMRLDVNVAFESQVPAALNLFTNPSDRPAQIFAEQMQRSGDQTDLEILAQDAVGAAIKCKESLVTLRS